MISSLCDKCILLHQGKILKIGDVSEVIHGYYSDGIASFGEVDYGKGKKKYGDETAEILKVRIKNEEGIVSNSISIDKSVVIEMEYEIKIDNARVSANYTFHNAEGIYAFPSADTCIDPNSELKLKKGIYLARCIIPPNFLNSGNYTIGFALSTMSTSKAHFYVQNSLNLEVVDPIYGILTRGQYVGSMPGIVRPLFKWECEFIK